MNNDMNNPQVPQQPVPAAPATPVAQPAAPVAQPATPVAQPATPVAQPATPAAQPAQPAAQTAPVAPPPMAQGTPTPMTLEQAMQPPEIPQQPIPEMQPMAPNPMQQMQPVGQEPATPQEAPKRKSKAPILFVIIIILLVVCGFVYKDTIMNMISPKQESTEKETTTKDETTVTAQLKTELNEKIGQLLYNKELLNNHIVVDYGFRSFVLTKELTDDEKEYIILKNIKYDKVDDVWEKIPVIKNFVEKEQQAATSSGTTYNLNGTLAEFGVKSKEDVAKEFKSLFGTELNIVKEEIGSCPTYYYDKDKDVFVQSPTRCGGTSGVLILYYVNSYNRDGDTVEVHMNFGAFADNKLYADFDPTKTDGPTEYFYHVTPKTEVTTTEKDSNGSPVINEKNYKDFSEYVFKFKKSSTGEFTFESVKQVEK